MYRPEIKRKRSGAPVLSRKEIDVIGQNIVGDFMPEALKSPQEIDIDLLAQDYLGMDQDFQYLSHCGVYLGMTVFNDTDKVPVYDPQNNCADYISAKAHTVIIDKTLLEENQEHRYRFTMGLSSAVLMPVSMVRMVAENFKRPGLQQIFYHYALAEEVASIFNVSFEAAGYRLKQLGYIPQEAHLSTDILNMISFDLACNY